MKKHFVIFLIIISASVGAAEFSAPFGFEWGVGKVQYESEGIVMTDCADRGYIRCSTVNPKKPLSIGESYLMSFHETLGLQKVIVLSKNFESDPYGHEGKLAYNTYKKALTEKYGEAEVFESIGNELYEEIDEFYECLDYEGCGYWATYFTDKESTAIIGLSIEGMRRGIGYIRIAYEGPEWAAIVDSMKEVKSKADADAL